MAKTISASVGRAGVNRESDTITVQELLNKVPEQDGGPDPLLEVDGLCGPLTKTAILNFQVKQYGWNLADGRVDPAGPTLARLNDFDTPQTQAPPPAPPPNVPKGVQFMIVRMGRETVVDTADEHLFFYVLDVVNNLAAVYWFRPGHLPKTTLSPPVGNTWGGSGGPFRVNTARAIDGLGCPAVWASRDDHPPTVTSKLVLLYPDGPAEIPMNHHLIGPGGVVGSAPPGTSGGGIAMPGELMFIERR